MFLGLCFLFSVFVSYRVYAKWNVDNVISCADSAIPYETTTEEDPLLPKGERKVETTGVNGTKQICTKANGTQVSSEVTVTPVNEVVSVGTYEEPEPYYEPEPEDSYDYNSVGCPKNQWVNGYYRSNGTYVQGYWRNSPNDDCF